MLFHMYAINVIKIWLLFRLIIFISIIIIICIMYSMLPHIRRHYYLIFNRSDFFFRIKHIENENRKKKYVDCL